jgi:hypothetical protein
MGSEWILGRLTWDVDWIRLAQDRDLWLVICKRKQALKGFMKQVISIEQPTDCILKYGNTKKKYETEIHYTSMKVVARRNVNLTILGNRAAL